MLYASAAYVERRLGEPRLRAADAGRQDFVGYDREWEKLPQHRWLVEGLGAQRFVVRSNSDDALGEALERGVGLGTLTEPQGRALGLVRIATETAGPTLPVFVSFHRDLRKVPRVRLVIDALEQGIRSALA
jgi:DNA-binding transcriptional LysR family regulator